MIPLSVNSVTVGVFVELYVSVTE